MKKFILKWMHIAENETKLGYFLEIKKHMISLKYSLKIRSNVKNKDSENLGYSPLIQECFD